MGAAPGNAGGRGRGHLGAHGTRIPFGGDVAGANLDVLLGSVGLDRNVTFIAAAYNQLPTRGGGEPALGELRSAVGDYPDSVSVLRDTVLAVGPRLIIALGNVAMRVTAGALRDASQIPTLRRLEQAGVKRGVLLRKPEVEAGFAAAWRQAWSGPLPAVLWLTHPSAQNMSPFAGPQTAFHQRMLAARRDLRAALRALGGFALPDHRAPPPDIGIYTLSEWRDHIAPVHARLDGLWRKHGV